MSWYCDLAPGHPVHGPYHDNEYGFPLEGDTALMERLALEINQAGLSWLIVLRKREAFRRAFEGFDVGRVAAYGEAAAARLMDDPAIIRNRRKIRAVIENARRVQGLGARHGSFSGWLGAHHPRPKAAWLRLFKETFVFTGPEITSEFLVSVGYLPGAHHPGCPVYRRIATLGPPWMRSHEAQGTTP
jgi:DNA-3-methyladenine glycosylase I